MAKHSPERHRAASGGSQRWSEIIVRDSQRELVEGKIIGRYFAPVYDGLVIEVVPSLPEVPNFQEGKIRKKVDWQNLAKSIFFFIREGVSEKMLDFLISFIEIRKKFENAISPGPPQQKRRIS